jgi:branched-chain amino acid transport system permease protein
LEIALEILPQVFARRYRAGFMYALIAWLYDGVWGFGVYQFCHSEIFVLGAFVGVEVLLLLQSAGLWQRSIQR